MLGFGFTSLAVSSSGKYLRGSENFNGYCKKYNKKLFR
jgi:hypothetical protein